MSIDQTLSKLQNIIHETLPELELFVDGNIQPSSSDCENLQKHLHLLQEHLSVFKHLKTHKEISPSFDLHSKVSEAAALKSDIVTEEVLKEEKITIEKPNTLTNEIETLRNSAEQKTQSTQTTKQIEVSLNQKFQFINDLFNQNATEYGLAVDHINEFENWQDAESYILSLKSAYNWKDSNETFKRFIQASKKRFE
jgi:hypothetical protein